MTRTNEAARSKNGRRATLAVAAVKHELLQLLAGGVGDHPTPDTTGNGMSIHSEPRADSPIDLEAMRSWVSQAIEAHVERRDRVRVEVLQPGAGLALFLIHVAETDRGRAIGHRGKVIKPIRDAVARWAGREGIRAVLDLAEPV